MLHILADISTNSTYFCKGIATKRTRQQNAERISRKKCHCKPVPLVDVTSDSVQLTVRYVKTGRYCCETVQKMLGDYLMRINWKCAFVKAESYDACHQSYQSGIFKVA